MTRKLRVLALDGGGVRGVIPAVVLAEIERVAGRPLVELFDLVAGTSTGGIIALALTVPKPEGGPRYTAQDVIHFYLSEIPRVFHRSTPHALKSAGSLRGPKYPVGQFERTLRETFADTRLSDVLRDVLITSYDIEGRNVHFFESWEAAARPDRNFYLRDIARATSAAPPYFPPARIESLAGPPRFSLVDGGIAANNPALTAYVHARRRVPGADVLLVSIGTGSPERPIPYEKARRWGAIGWATEVIHLICDGATKTTEDQLYELLPPDLQGPTYYRFQPPLLGINSRMDDARPANLGALEKIAIKLVRGRRREIEGLCGRLLDGQ